EGSRTMVITEPQPPNFASSGQSGAPAPIGTLKLRGARRSSQRVKWVEDTVDNEGMGKKKTKICCIYHKPKRFDESSDEDSSDEDSGADDRARPTHRHHYHDHHHHRQASSEGRDVHTVESDRDDRNAYEVYPRASKGKGKS
ncbi:hypothetical protein BV25DRAFT_1772106, partial [Artomyces pyxidatus]